MSAMNPSLWVPLGTVIGAVIGFLAARRTARATWRAKTVEWQYESVIGFFDATESVADTEVLDRAYRRLRITGPYNFLDTAFTMHQAARELRCARVEIARWEELLRVLSEDAEQVGREIDKAEDAGEHGDIAEYEHFDAAKDAADALKRFIDGNGDIHEPVKKADQYIKIVARSTQGDIRGLITGKMIYNLSNRTPEPEQLQASRRSAAKQLECASNAFIPQVRSWLEEKPKSPWGQRIKSKRR